MSDIIVMCHGHKHGTPILPCWIPSGSSIFLVDSDPNVDPDMEANFNHLNSILAIGREMYDAVVEQFCPIYGSPRTMLVYLCNLNHLIRPGGEMIILLNRSLLKHCRLPRYIKHLGYIRTRKQIDNIDEHLFKKLYHDGKLEVVDQIIRYIMHISRYSKYYIRDGYLVFVK